MGDLEVRLVTRGDPSPTQETSDTLVFEEKVEVPCHLMHTRRLEKSLRELILGKHLVG